MTRPHVPAPELRHCFDLTVDVGTPWEVGVSPAGERRVIAITGGTVAGPDLSGVILPGGADYQTIAPGGLTHLHARYGIETGGGERIYVENTGLRFGSPETLDRLKRGLPVDPALVYFRTTPRFETAAPRLAWMNTTLFVATGRRTPDQVLLSVFAL